MIRAEMRYRQDHRPSGLIDMLLNPGWAALGKDIEPLLAGCRVVLADNINVGIVGLRERA